MKQGDPGSLQRDSPGRGVGTGQCWEGGWRESDPVAHNAVLVGVGGLSELGEPVLSLAPSSTLPHPPSPKRQKAISPGVIEGIQVKGGSWLPFPSSQLLPLTPSLLGLCQLPSQLACKFSQPPNPPLSQKLPHRCFF